MTTPRSRRTVVAAIRARRAGDSRQSPEHARRQQRLRCQVATVAAKVKSTLAATVRSITTVVRNALSTSAPTKQPAAVATRTPVPVTVTTATTPGPAATTAEPKKPGTAATPPTGPPNLPGFNVFGGPTARGGSLTTFGPNSAEFGNGPTKFSHPVASIGCATCHNGRGAVGKSPKHVATNAPCENCHRSTVTFLGARLDHRSITAACATCHTGSRAVGKSPRHIATNAPCESCPQEHEYVRRRAARSPQRHRFMRHVSNGNSGDREAATTRCNHRAM